MAQAAPQPVSSELRLVLYDGVCGFCDRMVQWLIRRDEGRLLYAPLQGRAAAELRSRHPQIPEGPDTMVYVERRDGRERVFLRSDAVLQVLSGLESRWRWLGGLRWLPRSLRDLGYRLFARFRYRIFGRLETCRVPAPDERGRFLD